MADQTDDPENPSLEEIERQLAEAARIKETAKMYAGAAARMYEDGANARNRAAADRLARARQDLNLRLCRLLAVAKEKRDGRHANLSVLDLLIETLDTLTYDDKYPIG